MAAMKQTEILIGRTNLRWIVVLAALLACSGCGKRDLRGSYDESPDGKTYLVIVEKVGGCESITIDGKIWPHAIGSAGLIDPGIHTISCSGEIQFEIPRGVTFRFDYWGP